MQCDFLVIGAGIAGASAGYALSEKGKVVVLERESRPGYHTTGRSAATYIEFLGSRAIRVLSLGGKEFFLKPPAGFSETPLVAPRGCMIAAVEKDAETLRKLIADVQVLSPKVRGIDAGEALKLCPIMKPEAAVLSMYDPDAMDIDVAAVHQGFLRGLKARGGDVVVDAEVLGLERKGGQWEVRTPQGVFMAPVVVNAAGAWADVVGAMAGAKPIGLVPKRRTIAVMNVPEGLDAKRWPIVGDAAETWYFIPQGSRLLLSPADETPTDPCDAQPEEMDVALAVDRVETATALQVKRVESKWAGLRSFVADKTIVAGFAPEAEGFFWVAGQGGYGIQTSPGVSRVVGALATGGEIPADMRALGLTADMLAPNRPSLGKA